MKQVNRFQSPCSSQLRTAMGGLFVALVLAWSAPAQANPAKAAADREFAQAVKFFKEGRQSHAFGIFIAMANRGDVDAARIALFMHGYGATLYGMHWEAGEEDVEYWTNLVANSARSGRPQPDFVPVAVSRGKVRQVRGTAHQNTGVVGNR